MKLNVFKFVLVLLFALAVAIRLAVIAFFYPYIKHEWVVNFIVLLIGGSALLAITPSKKD